ncbi:NAD(P)-dependent alcohol dehydrogenase [Breznakiellaceae bacterium SP9]
MIKDENMKAINCAQYGSPDVLKLIETEKPTPKDDEVLVKIHTSSINSYDWRIMRGNPFLVRLREGLFKPKKNKILGTDIAGIVEAVGKSIKNFSIGDKVYGCMADSSGDGGFAEYKCAKESVLAPVPSGITLEQAASVPMAAVTALQGLRDVGEIQKGQKVLINGASGGVGTFAVQLAKYFGAEVTGVCSTRNAEMVRSIGADHVIDYTKEDYTQSGQQYDLILDIVANHTLSECRRTLKPNGTCAVVGFSTLGFVMKIMLFGKKTVKKDGKKVALVMANNTRGQDLAFLNPLLESEKVVPVIDGRYTLGNIQKAFEYFEKEHAKGKVVIKVI